MSTASIRHCSTFCKSLQIVQRFHGQFHETATAAPIQRARVPDFSPLRRLPSSHQPPHSQSTQLIPSKRSVPSSPSTPRPAIRPVRGSDDRGYRRFVPELGRFSGRFIARDDDPSRSVPLHRGCRRFDPQLSLLAGGVVDAGDETGRMRLWTYGGGRPARRAVCAGAVLRGC